jgi:hypothetical protein
MSGHLTPVTEDAHASASQLLARAARDYSTAQARRDRQSREDRVHGNSGGGGR